MKLFVLLSALGASIAHAGMSPNPSLPGPYAFSSSEYRLAAEINPDVLSDRMTEIWARAWIPRTNGPHPVVMFLHGNHGTCGGGVAPRMDLSCQYTETGTCPDEMIVTPNHEGYAYAAENLASWGFAVFSINANRGITCGGGVDGDSGLNLARGRLILAHLAMLSTWSREGGAPASLGLGPNGLRGRLAFQSVGIMGHSRGGEGARAALAQLQDPGSPWRAKVPGLGIRAIFEIGAVDGQTDRVLDADSVAWNQLLPLCDGDVSDLQGRNPFERMLAKKDLPADAQKSLLMVYGANHNYFNTQWQVSDSTGCKDHQAIFSAHEIGSPQQQALGLGAMSAFFRAHVGRGRGGYAELTQLFNPLYEIFSGLRALTRLDRDFAETMPSLRNAPLVVAVDDFDQAPAASTLGVPSESAGVTATQARLAFDVPTRVLSLSWTQGGEGAYYQTNWSSQGLDLSGYPILEFRAARPLETFETTPEALDLTLSLRLADGGSSRKLSLATYAEVIEPGSYTQLLQTVRIPVADFGLSRAELTRVKGLRFTFDRKPVGQALLANVRLSRFPGIGAQLALGGGRQGSAGRLRSSAQVERASEVVPASQNRIQSVRTVTLPRTDGRQARYVEIELASRVPFLARDALYTLVSGQREFRLSRYAEDGKLDRIRFLIPEREYGHVGRGFTVRLGSVRRPTKTWQF